MVNTIDSVKFKRTIGPKGNAPGISLPSELLEYINAQEGDTITLIGEKGKHGKYVALWKE